MSKPSALSLLLALSALSGCATPYPEPVLAASTGGTDFDGIAAHLGREPLDVILVHGMCTTDRTWADRAVRGVVSALGEDPGGVELTEVPVAGSRILLYQQSLATARGTLRFNAIVWSPLTTPLKADLCYDQTKKSATCPADEAAKAYPYVRASLNRQLKDTILNDCLSDALIYQGRSRDEINAQMQAALLQAVATTGGGPRAADTVAAAAAIPASVPLVVITESLGSKVAFDALIRLAAEPRTARAGARTRDRIATVFMAANQIPILSLADRRLDGTPTAAAAEGIAPAGAASAPYPPDPVSALFAHQRTQRLRGDDAPTTPRIVAFTDPNDLLSFALAQSPRTTYPTVDVVLSNDRTYFGFVELPTTAHQGYRTNPRFWHLVACGTGGKGCR